MCCTPNLPNIFTTNNNWITHCTIYISSFTTLIDHNRFCDQRVLKKEIQILQIFISAHGQGLRRGVSAYIIDTLTHTLRKPYICILTSTLYTHPSHTHIPY
jgi:hypothetical protein